MDTETKTNALNKVGIVAGGGHLPLLLAETLKGQNRSYFLLGIEGFAQPEDLAPHPHEWTQLATLGRTMKVLKDNRCQQVVMVGDVKRPDFKTAKLDWKAVKMMPAFLSATRRGDDALLTVLVKSFEEEGFEVIGADQILDDLFIPEGVMGKVKPNDENLQDIERAVEVIKELGSLDIGQGAVICNQLVLAVEAVEGTDAMLRRCIDVTTDLRGTESARRGVLVKLPKPGQERRVDLPTIGVETVNRAAKAGLSGIAVAAGGALVVKKSEVIAAANEQGLFIFGLTI